GLSFGTSFTGFGFGAPTGLSLSLGAPSLSLSASPSLGLSLAQAQALGLLGSSGLGLSLDGASSLSNLLGSSAESQGMLDQLLLRVLLGRFGGGGGGGGGASIALTDKQIENLADKIFTQSRLKDMPTKVDN